MKNLNTKQQELLNIWLAKNSFEGEKEPEWEVPVVIHVQSIPEIYQMLRELE